MVRSIELLLGMPPLSQYDAAATPFYAAFGTTPDLTPFKGLPAQYDVNEMNTPKSYGARESAKMNFADADEAPMHRLNEIIWKSVKGPDSPMPPPVRMMATRSPGLSGGNSRSRAKKSPVSHTGPTISATILRRDFIAATGTIS